MHFRKAFCSCTIRVLKAAHGVFTLAALFSLPGKGSFAVSAHDLWRVYGFHLPVLVVFMLAATTVRSLFGPERFRADRAAAGRCRRRTGKRVSVSLPGLPLRLFSFLCGAPGLQASGLNCPLRLSLTAAVFNILAGLLASLLVGVIFLVARVGRRRNLSAVETKKPHPVAARETASLLWS